MRMSGESIRAGFTLARRSVRLQIKEHALGYAWALLVPMLYAACYIFIKRQLSGPSEAAHGGWDVLRAFMGITLFQLWMHMVQETSGVIRRNKGFLRGMNVGPTPFVLAIGMEGLLSLVIRFVLIALAIPLLGLSWPVQPQSWLFISVALATLILSATAIGTLLAPWAAIYADVRKALASVSLPVILLSPIFYPAVEAWGTPLFWMNIVNPIGASLATLNASFQGMPTIYELPLLCVGAIFLAVNAFGLRQLSRQVPIVLERIGN